MAGEAPISVAGQTVALAATTASGNVALPSLKSNQLIVTNLGPDLCYMKFGTDNTVTAATTDFPIMPGAQYTVSWPTTANYIAARTDTTTARLRFSSGDGYLAGFASASTGASGITIGIAGGSVGILPGQSVFLNAAAAGGASYLHIAAGQATTTVKSGAGTLYAIILNSKATATNVTTIYDNTAGSGTVIGIPDAANATADTFLDYGPYGLAFATGLTIVTATANGSDMTVVYK